MERWPRAPQWRGYDYPSFSSSLLDAIYRSIDDECERSANNPAGGAPRDRRAGGAPDSSSVPVVAGKKTAAVERRNATGGERVPSRRRGSGGGGGSSFPAPISTSSSSENSSYGGFSSSEPESATAYPHPQMRLRPIRTAPDVSAACGARSSARPPRHAPPLPLPRTAPSKLGPSPPSPAVYLQDKKKADSIRSKLRDLRKPKTPASPGGRLAGFLNSLFASAGGNPRKPKGSPAMTPSAAVRGVVATTGLDESTCSTASSYHRSCLSKTPSSRGARPAAAALEAKRSVRFCPVSVIVDEDLRPCGQKSVYGEVRAAQPPAAAADGRVEREAKRRVEELLRRRYAEEGEDANEGSDSSSDLFELEIGRGSGSAGAGLGYRDELPVYETTNHHHAVRTYRPISHHF